MNSDFNRNAFKEDHLIKSIEICQKVTERMASNSFRLKAWFLVAFSALLTFFAKLDQKVVTDLAWILPLFFFAGLDAYYLKHERIFRLVHDDFVSALNGGSQHRRPFDLKPTAEQCRAYGMLHCLFSSSIQWLYFPLIIAFWWYVGFQTMEEDWVKWLTMASIPVLFLIGVICFRKDTDHTDGKPMLERK